jgi:hypothetical protein
MSAEMPACMGCFVSPPSDWSRFEIKPKSISEGLTDDEKLCLKCLADAWELFSKLSSKHPDDDNEFRSAIHDAQKMVALRVARRVDTDIWKQP